MNIRDAKYECMPREELEQLQLERLQATLNRAYKNVTFYRKMFHKSNVIPEDMQALSGLSKLPFTTKEDLRANYPYGMFAVPLREVVRVHSSSGTTEKPVVVGYTRNDIKVWTNLVARVMTAAGVTRDDMVQITFSYGLYTGAFGFHYGAEAIGASVIPTGTGNTEKQIMIMQDYKTTALVSTPTYAITLAERMEKLGINPKGLSLRVGLFGGEPLSEAMRSQIETRLGISATDNYGLSEIIGPGVAGECEYKCGMHIFEDAFIPEIVDPLSGKQLPAGSTGELVLTTLTKEAFPMIRYRTGDITSLLFTLCNCGRTIARMAKTMGRSDDMLIIKGVNVFPSQIGSVLTAVVGAEPQYEIVVDRKGAQDLLEVHIEAAEGIFFDEMKRQKAFLEMVEKKIRSVIGVGAAVKLVAPNTISRHEGTTGRVIDKREI
ncbi:MAG TPA: phenylacetate--CoA ligase [Syntrophales bacterium]|nr:phenylacetate--CoA ligase [Syntrophales bacterium]